ncbi:hypothetical protein [Streptomyces guryensis]|uniref:Uncharacterized protein n=1 Tax=Streptomyces guryensis TaxID=2886947 RepID=A0A9Q3VRI7_9ACTN|nr:hypothetical protein [Streptomyces guryensis]MCD9876832.1 hypothetical protein [Streptomyces guryensis]
MREHIELIERYGEQWRWVGGGSGSGDGPVDVAGMGPHDGLDTHTWARLREEL